VVPRRAMSRSPTAWAIRFTSPIPYDRGVAFMEALHAARVADEIPDTLLLLQHTPVVTLGRRGRDGHLLCTAEALAARGIALRVAGRGGDATYHGPGQWVLYPIIRLGGAVADAHSYLWRLEEVAIRTAGAFGVVAYRRAGMSGAWTDAGKIAAIGFYIRRWVTLHGMSFNVAPDMSGFETIVPCGLVGEKVASLATILGRSPPLDAVGHGLLEQAEVVLARSVQVFEESEPWPEALRQRWEGSQDRGSAL